MKTTMMLASIILTVGCSTEGVQKLADTAPDYKDDSVVATAAVHSPTKASTTDTATKQKPALIKPADTNRLPLKSASYSLAINQQKFTSSSSIVKAGQSLFNVQMQNFGVVKSSFVVISNHQPQWLSSDFSITEIAKQTFRLQSKSLDADLYQWYKRLAQDKRFSTVELEIDYSGKAYVPEF